MILYFTGTGNSAYIANRLGEELQDEVLNLFDYIKNQTFPVLSSTVPWVIVSPTYAWRMPRILSEWLKKVVLKGNRKIYFVMTCAGSISHAEAYAKKLCNSIGMQCMGCIPLVMPENYAALFDVPSAQEIQKILAEAKKTLPGIVSLIRQEKQPVPRVIRLKDRANSGIINSIYYPAVVHAKKFYAADTCVACGKCERVCPLNNISLHEGKPVWNDACTHCMACLSCCPVQAIEYGKKTIGKARYICPEKR